MAVIGADRLLGDGTWRVMVTGDTHPEYLDLAVATRLAVDLERAGEAALATRLSRAVETAKRQMQLRG